MCNIEKTRAIDHHLEPENTIVHFISRHTFVENQEKTIEVLHGKSQVKYHDIRFEFKEDFFALILKLSQQQNTAAIYIVMPNEWRAFFEDNYLGKINGTVIGWFIGFGGNDKKNKTEQILLYRNKHAWFIFPIEKNYGRSPIVKRPRQKKNKVGNNRPQKNYQKRTK